ncbi:MAG: hypothetical protein HY738_19845 [Bacteroidia bacterium]|nr:hypothetical protein [Bacteroidia bacterium]
MRITGNYITLFNRRTSDYIVICISNNLNTDIISGGISCCRINANIIICN